MVSGNLAGGNFVTVDDGCGCTIFYERSLMSRVLEYSTLTSSSNSLRTASNSSRATVISISYEGSFVASSNSCFILSNSNLGCNATFCSSVIKLHACASIISLQSSVANGISESTFVCTRTASNLEVTTCCGEVTLLIHGQIATMRITIAIQNIFAEVNTFNIQRISTNRTTIDSGDLATLFASITSEGCFPGRHCSLVVRIFVKSQVFTIKLASSSIDLFRTNCTTINFSSRIILTSEGANAGSSIEIKSRFLTGLITFNMQAFIIVSQFRACIVSNIRCLRPNVTTINRA